MTKKVDRPYLPKHQDITRKRFGRLIALDYAGKSRWLCKCDCGIIKSISTSKLNNGETKSCGCLQREITSKRNSTHNLRHTPEYCTWAHIKQRCANPRD